MYLKSTSLVDFAGCRELRNYDSPRTQDDQHDLAIHHSRALGRWDRSQTPSQAVALKALDSTDESLSLGDYGY